jgi:hypothetical protein
MTQEPLDVLEPTEFDALIGSYAARSEPDTLSFEAFDEATQRLAQDAMVETIELTGVVEQGAFVFDPPQTVPVIARGNEVVIGGLRLVVKLRLDPAVASAR